MLNERKVWSRDAVWKLDYQRIGRQKTRKADRGSVQKPRSDFNSQLAKHSTSDNIIYIYIRNHLSGMEHGTQHIVYATRCNA